MLNEYERDGIVIINLDYNLFESTVTTFREDMESLIEQGKINIVLNLKEVSYITSMGQSVLCALKRDLDPKNGWIRLTCVEPDLLKILAITKLIELFDVFDTVDEAVTFEV